ncbi:hypothetical protein [Neorhodopirellula pilleata]|uniref:Glycosyltransferase family 10 (Fucosyltransferase) n=1 Tax=Neorhodopirellula pilleata TaxID=2714738 RepID=A0A5C6A8K2_9BACT|nr:hypothetical protein [Neorhodopirellula pilleata]TWT95625.1 hypothetical protein Pla100_32660 [Neorhodopirellula pilleata]
MKRVHLCSIDAAADIYRRTAPSIPFQGHGCVFDCDPNGTGWLVFAAPAPMPMATHIPRRRRVLVVGEPSSMVVWSPEYLNQFGILLSPYNIAGFDGQWVESHPGLPWFYGWNRQTDRVLTHEELRCRPMPEKNAELSVVLSNKVMHQGHRTRLRFVEYLRGEMGNRLAIFGRGIRNVDDKASAIDPFRYHLVLENSIERNYWSEKLADSYLGYSFPLYAGCPNVLDWFDERSLVQIDIADPRAAAARVREIVDSRLFEDRQEIINQTRARVLGELSFPACIAAALQDLSDEESVLQQAAIIRPPSPLRFAPRVKREVTRLYHKLNSRILKSA